MPLPAPPAGKNFVNANLVGNQFSVGISTESAVPQCGQVIVDVGVTCTALLERTTSLLTN